MLHSQRLILTLPFLEILYDLPGDGLGAPPHLVNKILTASTNVLLRNPFSDHVIVLVDLVIRIKQFSDRVGEIQSSPECIILNLTKFMLLSLMLLTCLVFTLTIAIMTQIEVQTTQTLPS